MTHKDFKLGYDRIRLNTWCEDIKFTVITPNKFIEFDEMVVKFSTKTKHIALGSKLKNIRVNGGNYIKLSHENPVRLTHNETLTASVLLRAQS